MDLRREFTAVIAEAEATDGATSGGIGGILADDEPRLQVSCEEEPSGMPVTHRALACGSPAPARSLLVFRLTW